VAGLQKQVLTSVIRETVKEFIRDSKIIQRGEIGDMIYAVALCESRSFKKVG